MRKKVKVYPDSAFVILCKPGRAHISIATYQVPRPLDLLVQEKIFKEVFFTLYGHGGHLGHVTINIRYQFTPLINSKESPYEI